MSDEKTSKSTALFGLLPILAVLIIDLFCLYLQPHSHAIPHLAFAVLVAQCLCLLIFYKGEICPGQRGRLGKMQLGFALYWGLWLLLGLFSNYHYVLSDFLCLCGIIITIATYKQPSEDQLRNAMLKIALFSSVVGVICYGIILSELPLLAWLQYNIFAQIAVAIVLAHLALLVSKNRLHNFINLLPFGVLISLLSNVIVLLILLTLLSQQSAVYFAGIFKNELALALYFILHLLITLIIGGHIFRKTSLNYMMLMMMLLLSAGLPLWANFAYWA
ncbi:MAG: hypothetical protein Q4B95_00515 [Lonepinella koalarum]|nr:hypothetical protein [Lonepinella koalarum]